mgnify:FL=1
MKKCPTVKGLLKAGTEDRRVKAGCGGPTTDESSSEDRGVDKVRSPKHTAAAGRQSKRGVVIMNESKVECKAE